MTRAEMAEEIRKRDRLLEDARAERDRLERAVRWALGEAPSPDGAWFGEGERGVIVPRYWWRRKLRELAFAHPVGLSEYFGERKPPAELLHYKGWTGKQTENRLSHWIWRQYASAFWDDVRLDRVLPHRAPDGKKLESDDEKHVHPLQLDVIERALVLWSNPGETVLTPFMGVGSEVYGAVVNDRRGVGIELKASYFRQARKNLEHAAALQALGAPAGLFEQAAVREEEAPA